MENDMSETTLLTKAQRACAIDIMTNAYETGIAYWVERAQGIERDDDLNYLSYELLPVDFDEEGTWFTVTPERVWDAIEKLATSQADYCRADLRKTFKLQWAEEAYMETANPDAETDDVAIQVAIFGDIVYG